LRGRQLAKPLLHVARASLEELADEDLAVALGDRA
jgi:hypothetical protein